MIVHQLGSVLSFGDAVTNHIFEIDRRLRQWGLEARIYGADVSNAPAGQAQLDADYEAYLQNPDDLLLYHYSAYCDNYRLFQRSRNRKAIIYHNITPAEYFSPYDARYEALCRQGRALLGELIDCDVAVGVSGFNRRELVAAGFAPESTMVLPLFLGAGEFEQTAADPVLLRRLRDSGKTTLLFVGKVAPNKAFEDLITIFWTYWKYLNRGAQLVLVGARFLPAYDAVLDRLVETLGLRDEVIFTNRVRLPELRSYYEAANVFLCASRHEGFCAPLLEAMHFDLPVIARSCAAIPETLGDAGIQFRSLAYPEVSQVIHEVVTDAAFRQRIVAGQRRRLAVLRPEQVEGQLVELLGRLGVDVPAGVASR